MEKADVESTDNIIVEVDNKEGVSSEKPKKKAKEVVNKIVCKVNYNVPRKNKTSILYSDNNSNYSVFIDGLYNDTIEIEYTGKKFIVDNIKKVKQI